MVTGMAVHHPIFARVYLRWAFVVGARLGSAPARCWWQRGWTIPARDAGGASEMLWAWSTCPECRDRRWTG
jgi:hypothetical protein